MNKTINTRIQQNFVTKSYLDTSSSQMLSGEIAFAKDSSDVSNLLFKIGDGTTLAQDLPYYTLLLKDSNKAPIHDIYSTFRTYWRQNGLEYASNEDSTKIVGMKINNTKPTAINCSTLANSLLLNIPYDKSRYCKTFGGTKEPDITNPITLENTNNKYFVNLWSNPWEWSNFKTINSDNYNNYFLAKRMLSRMTELGMEIPAIRDIWQCKNYADRSKNEGTENELREGVKLDSWVEKIGVVNDLREAQPGDLVFWNNDGETETDPRAVSHVVTVLDRISYDSYNQNQPLLLIAEATSSASTKDGLGNGIQASYYMYDNTDYVKMIEDSTNGKYYKAQVNLSTAPIPRYVKNGENYIPCYSHKDGYSVPGQGDYIRTSKETYAKIFQDYYIGKKYISEDNFTDYALKVYDFNGDEISNTKIQFEINKKYIQSEDDNKKQGCNEHKIPKFICRPKYNFLSKPSEGNDFQTVSKVGETAYRLTSENINSSDLENESTPYKKKDKSEIVTIVIEDIKPGVSSGDTLISTYVQILGKSQVEIAKDKYSYRYEEILRYYIPEAVKGTTNSHTVKLPIIVNSQVSSSKQDEKCFTSNLIQIKICSEVKEINGDNTIFKTKIIPYTENIKAKIGVTV